MFLFPQSHLFDASRDGIDNFALFSGAGLGITHTASNTVAMDIYRGKEWGLGMGFYTLSLLLPPHWPRPLLCGISTTIHLSISLIIASCSILLSMIIALCIKYPSIELKPTSLNFKEFIEISALRPAVTGFIVMFTNSVVMTYLPLFVTEIGLESGGYFLPPWP